MLKIVIGALIIAATFAVSAQGAGLAGSEWGIKGKPQRFVQFRQDGKLSGFSGCNRFFGGYKVSGTSISISRLAGTRKMCPASVMKAEARFLKALQRTKKMKKSKRTLDLFNENGVRIMSLLHRDWD